MERWFETMAGCLGKTWRTNRRRLKPPIRDAFAALLLEVRLEYLPDAYIDGVSNVGRARSDIRGIAELLKHVADRSRNIQDDVTALPGTVADAIVTDTWHAGATDPWGGRGAMGQTNLATAEASIVAIGAQISEVGRASQERFADVGTLLAARGELVQAKMDDVDERMIDTMKGLEAGTYAGVDVKEDMPPIAASVWTLPEPSLPCDEVVPFATDSTVSACASCGHDPVAVELHSQLLLDTVKAGTHQFSNLVLTVDRDHLDRA